MLAPQGVRVVCLRSDALPETWLRLFRQDSLLKDFACFDEVMGMDCCEYSSQRRDYPGKWRDHVRSDMRIGVGIRLFDYTDPEPVELE